MLNEQKRSKGVTGKQAKQAGCTYVASAKIDLTELQIHIGIYIYMHIVRANNL